MDSPILLDFLHRIATGANFVIGCWDRTETIFDDFLYDHLVGLAVNQMALHGDQGDAQITDAIEQAVQCRLVELSADDGLVVRAGGNFQPFEPTQPAFIEFSLETDLILSGSIRGFHCASLFQAKWFA